MKAEAHTTAAKNRTLLIFILGLLSAIGPFSIDMYLPGFSTIATSLHTTVDKVGYSLSSFFTGICAGQLLCGPLLDRFGRKRPLLIGLTLYVIASVACSLAHSVEGLIAFRFLQALGGCVGMVAPNAIVRDVFPVHENARIFSLLILILGVSPILAPTVGSYVVAHAGWEVVFIVLAIVATVILLLVGKWLPESKAADATVSLKPVSILRGYGHVLKEPQFATYAFSGAVASAGLFAYLAGSPFVFMELYGVSEQQYGFIFALIAAGLIGCSQLNNRILKKVSSEKLLHAVMVSQSLIGLLLVLGVATGLIGLYGTVVLMLLFLSCQGFTFPNAAALAMAPFTKGAGSASALMGALQMVFGALATALVGLFFNGTALPTGAIMAFCAVSGLAVLRRGRRRLERAANKTETGHQTLGVIETF